MDSLRGLEQLNDAARIAAYVYAELQKLYPMFDWTYVIDRDRPGSAKFTAHATVRGNKAESTQSCLLHPGGPPASVLAEDIGWECVRRWVMQWRGDQQG